MASPRMNAAHKAHKAHANVKKSFEERGVIGELRVKITYTTYPESLSDSDRRAAEARGVSTQVTEPSDEHANITLREKGAAVGDHAIALAQMCREIVSENWTDNPPVAPRPEVKEALEKNGAKK